MSISRMIYMDDSGSEASGTIVYGWIECAPNRWRYGLRELLELRKQLYRDYQAPPSKELHATEFLNGRARVSTNASLQSSAQLKKLGQEVGEDCLRVLASSSEFKFGSVYRSTALRGRDYYEEKGRVYQSIIERWNVEHRAADTYALISMDGDGTDPTYFDAHRGLALDDRHIIEDPMFHDSRRSQLVQMADLIAYLAFVHLNRHQGNQFGWHWYDTYLAPSSLNGAPEQI